MRPLNFCIYFLSPDLNLMCKKHKANGIYREIRKHMYQPRHIDVVVFFVEIVEYHASDKKSEQGKKQHGQSEPSDHHSYMVKCEQSRAENVRKSSR